MVEPRQIRNIALIGFMGTGKSTVGQLVAAQIDFAFVDTDRLIEERAGRSIPRIFADWGEQAFRDIERAAIRELSFRDRIVIATGGGLGANPENLSSLKKHALVVCLWASLECIFGRLRQQAHRPILQAPEPADRIRQLFHARSPFYRQADALVNTEWRTVTEVAQQVLHQFRLVGSTPAR